MNTKTLSNRALNVIDQYLHFKVGAAVCSIPYFNNKTAGTRGALGTYIGKGSPREIFEEIQALAVKAHVDFKSFNDESLEKMLVDNAIGIDCSGFAYYVLNAENEERGKGSLEKHISFVNCHGLFGKIRCSLRPIENCDVSTLANNKNSKVIRLTDIAPGDIITMLDDSEESERDHILIIHQVEYQNFIPYKIHYSHAAAYPEDGIYGSGIKQGVIEILNIDKPIIESRWIENEKQGEQNRIFARAEKSRTEVRRLE